MSTSQLVRDYVTEKARRAQQVTINDARRRFKERGCLDADFAIQKWMEIFAQDALVRAIRDDDVTAMQNARENLKLAETTLP